MHQVHDKCVADTPVAAYVEMRRDDVEVSQDDVELSVVETLPLIAQKAVVLQKTVVLPATPPPDPSPTTCPAISATHKAEEMEVCAAVAASRKIRARDAHLRL